MTQQVANNVHEFMAALGCADIIRVDARFKGGAMPVDLAKDMMIADHPELAKKKRLPKPPAKTWEEVNALAKILNVRVGASSNTRGIVLTQEGCSIIEGHTYSFKWNRSAAANAYEALLQLRRDQLARMTDEQLYAEAEKAKELFL